VTDVVSGASVLVTGGTGSFGRKFTKIILEEHDPAKVIVFSRDELKQEEMRQAGFDDLRLRYFIGDVRDVERLRRAMHGVDIVVHAAAMKQVPACEYNPLEAIMTNIDGARNVANASMDSGVGRVLNISTDKAVNPTNLYGATKLCAEKLLIQSNSYAGSYGTRLSCVRYGNVVGSRGSVIPMFEKQRELGRVTVTDPAMTRFWLTLEQGVRFVIHCLGVMRGGEVFVPKVPSMNILSLAAAIAPESEIDVIGIRPGEKMHELLVSEHEARHTNELDDMYVIKPDHPWWGTEDELEGDQVPDGFRYASDTNQAWLTPEDLLELVRSAR
jgi:UDP-N-acetylglucosamine 4,6-dehydratase/5-epimerase